MIELIRTILAALEGYRTYICTILIGALGIFWKAQLIGDESAALIGGLLWAMAKAAERQAIGRVEMKLDNSKKPPEPSVN